MNLLHPLCDSIHEVAVTLAIIPHESLTVLEHRLRGLLGVIEGVVFFAKIILNDADLRTQGTQRLAVLGIVHTHCTSNTLCLTNSIIIGCINRRQPLGQQGYRVTGLQSCTICSQLLFNLLQGLTFASSAHQSQQVIVTTILRNVLDVFLQRLGLIGRQPLEDGTEHTALTNTTTDITCKEQGLHRQV